MSTALPAWPLTGQSGEAHVRAGGNRSPRLYLPVHGNVHYSSASARQLRLAVSGEIPPLPVTSHAISTTPLLAGHAATKLSIN